MKKEIFINESMGETRIAIQEDGQIVEVYIERQDKQRMVGNIYKGKVENVLPGMQACFVDIGLDRRDAIHLLDEAVGLVHLVAIVVDEVGRLLGVADGLLQRGQPV